MPRLKCPRCATVIDVAPGATPVCSACGFGGPAPPAPAPEPAAQTGWSSPPPMQSGFSSPPPMAGYSSQPMMGGQRKTAGVSIAALVLGICALCLGWIPFIGIVISFVGAILAVSFGAVGIKKANANPNVGGKGLAITGLVLGIVGLALWAIVLLFFAALFSAIGAGAV